jgi:hypothetical protein
VRRCAGVLDQLRAETTQHDALPDAILGSWLETARSWTRMVLSAPHTFALVSPGSFEDASLAVRMGGVAARPHR